MKAVTSAGWGWWREGRGYRQRGSDECIFLLGSHSSVGRQVRSQVMQGPQGCLGLGNYSHKSPMDSED